MTAHTIEEALDKFRLVNGAGSEDRGEACVMTALAWVAGEAWTDRPACAHPILARWVIAANDHPDTTEDQRRELVRLGETGVIDTWWVPAEVLVDCWARAGGDRRGVKVGNVIRNVAAWKADTSHKRPVLRGAVLLDAVLRGADLRGADLRGADLRGADLRGADLRDADLRDADLSGAVLLDAVLRGAVLRDADLRGAVLSGAFLPFGDVPAGWVRDGDGFLSRAAALVPQDGE